MMKGVESILTMLREKLVPGRKLQDTESQRLRDAYLTPAWGPTNIAFDEFVMGLFEKGLAADTAEVDAKWPMRDRFKQGATKLFSTSIPELKAWIDKQHAPDVPGAGEGDMADDDSDNQTEDDS
jgi:hypothetical protein